MLQSGSFFTPALDPQESGYGYFGQVTGFVAPCWPPARRRPGPRR